MDKNTKQELKRIWCERLVIGLFASVSLSFFVTKLLVVCSQVQEQAKAEQTWMLALSPSQQAQVKARVPAMYQRIRAQAQAQAEEKEREAGLRSMAYYQHAREQKQNLPQSPLGALQYQLMLLGISAKCFILMMMLLTQRNQISLPLTGQLIIVLPEEYIADLEALYQYKNSQNPGIWVIRKEMLWTVLGMLWAFHVQINLENLWLPQNKARKKIDD